jgi:hypothetical protein
MVSFNIYFCIFQGFIQLKVSASYTVYRFTFFEKHSEFLLVPTPMNTRVITNMSAALFSNLRGTEVYPLKEGNIKAAYI